MNKVMLSGFVSTDITAHDGNTPRITFSVAVSEYFGGDSNVQFIPCVMFGKGIDFVQKYFKKGSGIEVEGRLNIYKNDEGKIYTSVMVKSVEFGKGKGKDSDGGAKPVANKKEQMQNDNPFDDSELADLF